MSLYGGRGSVALVPSRALIGRLPEAGAAGPGAIDALIAASCPACDRILAARHDRVSTRLPNAKSLRNLDPK